MNKLFFRENLHDKRKLLDIFSSKAEQIFKKYIKLENEYSSRKTELLSAINIQIKDQKNKDSNEMVQLLKLRKRIHKDKEPTQAQLSINIGAKYSDVLNKYRSIRSQLLDRINDIYLQQKMLLLTNLSLKDIVLSKNRRIKHLVLDDKDDINLKDKDILSLYGLTDQLALKTGAFGFTGRVGLVESGRVRQPNRTIVVKVQGYLMARLYKNYLMENLKSFTGTLYVNSSYKVIGGKYIFDVLMDNTDASLFLNSQKKIAISQNNVIDKLVKLKRANCQSFLSLLGEEKLKKLINLGIVLYEGMDDEIGFNTIIDHFDVLAKSDRYELEEMGKRVKHLNSSFNVHDFQCLDADLMTFFRNKNISCLGRMSLTVDSFVESKSNSEGYILNLVQKINGVQKQLDYAANFFSTIDAAYYTQRLAYEYIESHYPEGIRLSNGNLHSLLVDISKFINQKLNIGKVRTGFSSLPITAEIFKHFSLNREIILDNKFLSEYFKENPSFKNHSYSMFLQKAEDGLVINHVYKGYGVFVRRFWNNFNIDEDNEDYGLQNLYDIPYNFGFNVSYRPNSKGVYFGFLPQGTVSSNPKDICINEITMYPDKLTKQLIYYDDKGKTINLSYLGSLNPIAYPAMLLELNSITLTSSLYFDLGDLLLRELYQHNPNKGTYKVPEIFFENKNLLISRSKTLISSKTLLNIVNQSDFLESYRALSNLLAGEVKFFVREFVVDFSKFNRRMTKPMFVDLTQPISIKAFLRYIKNVEWVVLERATPSAKVDSDKRQLEFIYETSATDGEGD